MSCGKLPQPVKDAKRYKKIASCLPLLKGTIIKSDGTVVQIADLFGIPKTPADPQLAKAQNIFPYIRDTVILENGETCLLSDIIQIFLDKFDEIGELDEKWTAYLEELYELLQELQEYLDEINEKIKTVYTSQLRLDYIQLQEGDWNGG